MISLYTQISRSDEKALDKSFCEKYFMTTKRNCMSSSPFEDSGSHGSTLENLRPSVNEQVLDFKSRSLRTPRTPFLVLLQNWRLHYSVVSLITHLSIWSNFQEGFIQAIIQEYALPIQESLKSFRFLPSANQVSTIMLFKIYLLRYLHFDFIFFLLCKFIISVY